MQKNCCGRKSNAPNVVSPKGTNRNDGTCPQKLPKLPRGQNFQDDLLERVPYVSNRGGGAFLVSDARLGWGRTGAQKTPVLGKQVCPGDLSAGQTPVRHLSAAPVRSFFAAGAVDSCRTGDLSAKKCGQVPRTGPGQVTCPQKNADRSP